MSAAGGYNEEVKVWKPADRKMPRKQFNATPGLVAAVPPK